jgi:hypothetical protein
MSTVGKRILEILGWVVGIVVALLVVLVVYVQMSWDAKDGRTAPNLKAKTDSATIAQGEYILKYQAQCWGCHNSSSRDISMAATGEFGPPVGGFLFDLSEIGPGFGKWYLRNLTPDIETGLGGWTDGEIVQALREGLSKDRTTLFPNMPYAYYKS